MSKAKTKEPHIVKRYPLKQLHLDTTNPRFGGTVKTKDETSILDTITTDFGIDDVLSSIALNGFFESEPLVGVQEKGKSDIKIVEGNRRLAACLILAEDPRAKNQGARRKAFNSLKHDISSIPVLVYDEHADRSEILPYLGVRHIVGSQPWDSYAKAAWVARVLADKSLTLKRISEMIGDRNKTVARILEGFYFVNQLTDAGRFNPEDSHRMGRGSNPLYPFSWVYTALGYKTIRLWLDLSDFDLEKGPDKHPVSKDKLDEAQLFIRFLFGNKTKSITPVVPDSRDIGDLAILVASPESIRLLEKGKTVPEVIKLNRPRKERILLGLFEAIEQLQQVMGLLGESQFKPEEISEFSDANKRVKALSKNIQDLLDKPQSE